MHADKDLRSIKGDFIGFTFGGIHSSELGLMRVSDGSRYNEDLLPPLQDKKAQVTGRDGEIYFGSQYMTKPIKVPVAFDNMNEESFQKLRKLLSNKKPQFLWFDEKPYKQWLVKTASAQSFKWVCFDEYRNEKKERIYKGEGTLEFNCFSSYATSRVTYLDDPIDKVIIKNEKGKLEFMFSTQDSPLTLENFYNFNEWEKSSGLKKRKNKDINYEENIQYIKDGNVRIGKFIYNAGDVPIKPQITLKEVNKYTGTEEFIIINLYSSENLLTPIQTMQLSKDIIKQCSKNGDQDIIIDSKLKLLKGVNERGRLSGKVYNKFHKEGDYFEIPVGKDENEIFMIEIKSDIATLIEYTHQYY